MGELKEAKSRWSQKMPKFFKKVMWLCGIVSGGMPDDRVIENHNTILDKDDN